MIFHFPVQKKNSYLPILIAEKKETSFIIPKKWTRNLSEYL
jgi:hypothetical protein